MLRQKKTLLSLVVTRQKNIWSTVFCRTKNLLATRMTGWPTKIKKVTHWKAQVYVWTCVYIEISPIVIVESYGRCCFFYLRGKTERKGETTGTQKDGGIWWSLLSISWFWGCTRCCSALLFISDLHIPSHTQCLWDLILCLSNLYWKVIKDEESEWKDEGGEEDKLSTLSSF